MQHKQITTLDSLREFVLERVINDDPISRTLTLLGTFPSPSSSSSSAFPQAQNISEPSTETESEPKAILRIEQTPLNPNPTHAMSFLKQIVRAEVRLVNDIYSTLDAWFDSSSSQSQTSPNPNLKVNVIYPATQTHIRKYSKQQLTILHETPAIYESIVKPYIEGIPPKRLQWVYDILTSKSEASSVLLRTPEFVLLPDMKWTPVPSPPSSTAQSIDRDSHTHPIDNLDSLYLVAIATSPRLKSLRDLRKEDVGLLRDIRDSAARVVSERWGLGEGGLRMYVHYLPSYYQFHVHIVNANHTGLMGMAVGQAHLLDDIISLLDISPPSGPTILEQMTFTYGMGREHELFERVCAAQGDSTF